MCACMALVEAYLWSQTMYTAGQAVALMNMSKKMSPQRLDTALTCSATRLPHSQLTALSASISQVSTLIYWEAPKHVCACKALVDAFLWSQTMHRAGQAVALMSMSKFMPVPNGLALLRHEHQATQLPHAQLTAWPGPLAAVQAQHSYQYVNACLCEC